VQLARQGRQLGQGRAQDSRASTGGKFKFFKCKGFPPAKCSAHGPGRRARQSRELTCGWVPIRYATEHDAHLPRRRQPNLPIFDLDMPTEK